MGWYGFKKGLRDLTDPPYLRDMTPDERELRRRRSLFDNWGLPWFAKAIEPPPKMPRTPSKSAKHTGDETRDTGR